MMEHQQRLRRLPTEAYRGHAWVHWTLTLEARKTGWLDGRFYYKFREILTHVCFRDQIACPIFCMMPDHMHLLLCGVTEGADQLIAMRRLRKATNDCLHRIGCALQRQAYDHVLRDHERERDAVETIAEYIARNPERKGRVTNDGFASYPFSGCLMPGYPQLRLYEPDSWDRIWRILAYLRRTDCFQKPDPERKA